MAQLKLKDLDLDPIVQFQKWYAEAEEKKIIEPDAITLATASKDGKPSARTMLYKGVSKNGIKFFTNYESPKAKILEENPQAAVLFYWEAIERQVRFEGKVEKISREESEEYFKTRPRNSQLGACASKQSQPISGLTGLMAEVAKLDLKYIGRSIPCPPNWGGYRLIPDMVEFWQEGPFRIHLRFRYTLKNGNWNIEQLSP